LLLMNEHTDPKGETYRTRLLLSPRIANVHCCKPFS